MSRFGVQFDENMYGTFHPVAKPGDPRPFMFHVSATAPSLRRVILGDGRMDTSGYVQADGFATRAPLSGQLVIRPLLGRFIRYEFEFTANDGARYRYAGEKTIRHLKPKQSWTTLPGSIYDAGGAKIYDSESRFDLTELLPFLRSYQLTAG